MERVCRFDVFEVAAIDLHHRMCRLDFCQWLVSEMGPSMESYIERKIERANQ